MKSAEERFWSKVDKRGPDDCWEWTGARLPNGYGVLTVSRKHFYAHRFAYQITHGPIPSGRFACHHCDNPPCCNPAHIYAGTPADNVNDSYARNNRRRGHGRPKGSLSRIPRDSFQMFLKVFRTYNRLSQTEVSRRAGLSDWVCGEVERGKVIPTRAEIDALKAAVDWDATANKFRSAQEAPQ